MTFPEIFPNLQNHSYVRRESWSKHVFIQYRHSTPLFRLVMFATSSNEKMRIINTLDNDYRISAEDIMGNDWIDIENCNPDD